MTLHVAAMVATLVTGASAATPADGTFKERWRHRMERARGWFETLNRNGVTPQIGTIVAGSSLAFGATYERPQVFSSPIGFAVDGQVSIHGFTEAGVRVGYLARRHSAAVVRPADTRVSGLLEYGRRDILGAAVFLEHRYRRSPSLPLYGEIGDERLRADFGVSGTTTDAVLQWQLTRAVGVAARVGVLQFDLSRGRNGEEANVEDVFGTALLSIPQQRAEYVTTGLGVIVDSRDSTNGPTRGLFTGVTAWHYAPRQSPILSAFTRLTVDLRGFVPLHGPRHVLALRGLVSRDVPDDATRVPFFLTGYLGGSYTMRGLKAYEWRGTTLATGTVEDPMAALVVRGRRSVRRRRPCGRRVAGGTIRHRRDPWSRRAAADQIEHSRPSRRRTRPQRSQPVLRDQRAILKS